MKVLVSGGAGFIGSHLVERLVEDGDDVRIVDDLSAGRSAHLAAVAGSVELIRGDIRDPATARSACRDRDVVLHLAGLPSVPRSFEEPRLSHDVNATGTLTLALAARDAGVGRFINTSSSSVYGPGQRLPLREDARPNPISPYAVAKLAAEGYCRALATGGAIEAVTLRLFNVYGPRQSPHSRYGAVVPSFITHLLAGRRATIFGDGRQSRSFTFVGDVVSGMLLAARAGTLARETYNVASPNAVSVIELFETLRELTASQIEPRFAPPRVGDLDRSVPDVSAARADLGFEAAIPLPDGLARTVSHIRAGAHPAGSRRALAARR